MILDLGVAKWKMDVVANNSGCSNCRKARLWMIVETHAPAVIFQMEPVVKSDMVGKVMYRTILRNIHHP